MPTLHDRYTLATNATLLQRARMAGVLVAGEVLGEPTTTPGHALRRALAMAVILDPAAYDSRMAAAVVTDDAVFAAQLTSGTALPVLTTAAADGPLVARVRAVWGVLAGFSGP